MAARVPAEAAAAAFPALGTGALVLQIFSPLICEKTATLGLLPSPLFLSQKLKKFVERAAPCQLCSCPRLIARP